MKLPQHLVDSKFFLFTEENDFHAAIKSVVDEAEILRIDSLLGKGLMPITSKEVLATIFGLNPGIIWSFIERPSRHYRRFTIPKGKSERHIFAPRVGLKIIQKWISSQLQQAFEAPHHVFGFVPNRSHIEAAAVHTGASWVYSIDIENFFPTTPEATVRESLQKAGYDEESAKLISGLTCFGGNLAQGAPSSPVLSNMCMSQLDAGLGILANEFGLRVTRYADDISFSSSGDFPEDLVKKLEAAFAETPWKIASEKTHFAVAPDRLKVHGLLVHGDSVRLTKGYRNKIRAYRHMLKSGKCRAEDVAKLSGHLAYAHQVTKARDD